jgi:peptidoglycan/xylan/chitin deacetylase (PgdA/CDA1 family)
MEPHAISVAQLRDEIVKTQEAIADITGTVPTLFRPPKGKLTIAKALMVWRLRKTIVLWNVDPQDYARNPDDVLGWVQRYSPRNGDVVLLHDKTPSCVVALETLLARERGTSALAFETIQDWLPRAAGTTSGID